MLEALGQRGLPLLILWEEIRQFMGVLGGRGFFEGCSINLLLTILATRSIYDLTVTTLQLLLHRVIIFLSFCDHIHVLGQEGF